MKPSPLFALALSLPLGLAAACSAASTQTSSPADKAKAPAAATAAPAAIPSFWYAKGLDALGFYVFPQPVDVGDFAAEALKGPPVRLSDQRGKVVLLNFWATWCPSCREEMPSIEKLWIALKAEAFTIMAISIDDDRPTVEKFVSEKGYSYPMYFDRGKELGTAFNASAIPTTYIVDKDGKVIAGTQGAKEYDDPELVAMLRDLAAR